VTVIPPTHSRLAAAAVWLLAPWSHAASPDGSDHCRAAGSAVNGFELDGSLQPVRQSTVAAQVGGSVMQLLVKAGDRVASGQVIARIDERDAQAGMARSDAAWPRPRPNWPMPGCTPTHAQPAQQNFVSQAALDVAETQLKAAEAGVQQAKAGRTQAALARGFTAVTAPSAGPCWRPISRPRPGRSRPADRDDLRPRCAARGRAGAGCAWRSRACETRQLLRAEAGSLRCRSRRCRWPDSVSQTVEWATRPPGRPVVGTSARCDGAGALRRCRAFGGGAWGRGGADPAVERRAAPRRADGCLRRRRRPLRAACGAHRCARRRPRARAGGLKGGGTRGRRPGAGRPGRRDAGTVSRSRTDGMARDPSSPPLQTARRDGRSRAAGRAPSRPMADAAARARRAGLLGCSGAGDAAREDRRSTSDEDDDPLPGASSADLQNMVARPGEQVLSQIHGIEHTYSVAPPGHGPAHGAVPGRRARTEALGAPVRRAQRQPGCCLRAWHPEPIVRQRASIDVPVLAGCYASSLDRCAHAEDSSSRTRSES